MLLYEHNYGEWLSHQIPLEISDSRLTDITNALERLASLVTPEAAHEWLYKDCPALRRRVPARILRVGPIQDVVALIESKDIGIS